MFRSRRSHAAGDCGTVDHGVHEHDLGLGHDLAVMNRRAALRGIVGAAGVGAVGLTVGCSTDSATGSGAAASSNTTASQASSTVVSAPDCVAAAPGETAGPYPGDGSNGPNVLIESGVHRSDITSSFGGMDGTAEGVPMHLTMNLQDLTNNCAPGAAMAVYVWQCDREGRYSLYSDGVTEQNYLRGVQTADESGGVEFTSIFPACYSGRWPHVHFEVYDTLAAAVAGDNARLTSQIALSAAASDAVYAYDPGYAASIPNLSGVSLESDMVFSDGWDAQMPTVTGSPETGYAVSITIGVAATGDNAQRTPGGSGGRPPGPPPNSGTGPSW